MTSPVLSPVRNPIDYPTTDGQPLAETDWQAIPLIYAVTGLRDYFKHRDDVCVSGNLLIYYEEGNSNAAVAPDVFVVVGAPNHTRPIYKIWEEPKGPDFVLEITSKSTRTRDEGEKRNLYERLGVAEYWRYDPTGDYLDPPLSGLHLRSGEYVARAPAWSADGSLVMYSRVLGLELRIIEGELRFRDRDTGHNLLTLSESNEARQRAEQERQEERLARRQVETERDRAEAARRTAEARIAELEALLNEKR